MFCLEPWNHISIGTLGQFELCCQGNAQRFQSIWNSDLKEHFYSPEMYKIRLAMLENEFEIFKPHCLTCIRAEEEGTKSRRQRLVNNRFYIDSEKPEPRSIHIKVGNICNQSCRTCGPLYSSKIALLDGDDPVNGVWDKKSDLSKFWKSFDDLLMNNLKLVKLTGGEPTISKFGITVLERIAVSETQPDLHVEITTNLKKFTPNIERIFQTIYNKLGNRLIVNVSIDDLFQRNDYIRNDSKFSDILKNVIKLQNIGIYVNTITTICMYNIMNILNILEYVSPYSKYTSISPLINPDGLNIRHLPEKLKEQIRKDFNDWDFKISPSVRTNLASILQILNQPGDFSMFLKYHNTISHRYTNNHFDVFPEFGPYL